MGLVVATSTVADGNMLERHDPNDLRVVENRRTFLKKQNIDLDQATRLNVDTLNRATVLHEQDWLRYIEVEEKDKGSAMKDDNFAVGDVLITTHANHALFLGVADCVGAVFYDPTTNVLALAHLGRHSLEQNGGQAIIEYLGKTHGVDPKNIKVWLTPAPGKDVYPIWALDNKGMKEVTFEQLYAAGIRKENITDNPIDTDKDLNYFSYTEFYNGRRTEDGDYAIVAMMTN